MIFKLCVSGVSYDEKKEVQSLQKLGFKFEKGSMGYNYQLCRWCQPTIEINTLEELNAFTEEYGAIVYDGKEIEIYNSYRE